MQGIKRKLKYIDTWLHDLLMNNENLYFRIAHTSLPDKPQDVQKTLSAIHKYDIKKFGNLPRWRKVKILLKSELYRLFLFFRKTFMLILLRIFLFRDKVLGRSSDDIF